MVRFEFRWDLIGLPLTTLCGSGLFLLKKHPWVNIE
jgi:hypothetical protein